MRACMRAAILMSNCNKRVIYGSCVRLVRECVRVCAFIFCFLRCRAFAPGAPRLLAEGGSQPLGAPSSLLSAPSDACLFLSLLKRNIYASNINYIETRTCCVTNFTSPRQNLAVNGVVGGSGVGARKLYHLVGVYISNNIASKN
jgi:hypothetical protein